MVVTLLVFPVLATVLGAWITGGFGWLARSLRPEPKPIIEITQPPRYAPANPQDQRRAEQAGLDMVVRGICPWTVRTVPVPPDQIDAPVDRGTGLAEVYRSHRLSGDANYTRLALTVRPPDERTAVRVTGVDIRVLDRRPAPAPDAATVVALGGAGCGVGDSSVYLHALLDGGGEIVPLIPDRGSPSLPQVVKDDKGIEIEIVVGTTNCDCTWVPVVHWAVGGGEVATSEYRLGGQPFRTLPAGPYRKLAWQMNGTPNPDGFYGWTTLPSFPEELLTFDPYLSRTGG